MHIYRNIVISLTLTLIFVYCHGQKSNDGKVASSATGNSNSTEAQIILIRKEYNRIISDEPKCKVLTEDMDDRSTEGGEMKRFFLGKNLEKARLIFYGETGKAVFEYYFVNGEVIFFLKRNYDYNIPMYMKGSKVSKIEEDRFYFSNKKLIRWIGTNGKIIAAIQYPAREKEILNELNETVFR